MNGEVDSGFRLRGEVGGRLRVIEPPPGAVSVGAAPDNTVVLDVATVSRRHALLEGQGETVLVKDTVTDTDTDTGHGHGHRHRHGSRSRTPTPTRVTVTDTGTDTYTVAPPPAPACLRQVATCTRGPM